MRRGLALLCLAACSTGAPEPRELPPVAEPPGPVAEPPAPQMPDPVTAVPASHYANQWLVITASDPEPTPVPDALGILMTAHPDRVRPDILDSGEFKGLMPCWSITIAGAAGSRGAATELLELVKGAGIDAYIKNAGEHIGPTDAVDAVCNELRSEDGECAGDVRLATRLGGRWHVPLNLPESMAQAALRGAPAPMRADEWGSAWTAPLVVETLGDVGVGDALTVHAVSGAPALSCTVSGFAATTLGVPHFGADDSRPTCGTPEPMAVLSCPDDGGMDGGTAIVTAPDAAAYAWAKGAATTDVQPLREQVVALPGVAPLYAEAEREALARSETLKEAVRAWPVSHAGASGHIVELQWSTGDGFAACGGDDLLVRVAIAIDASGNALSDAVEIPFAQVTGLVTLPGEASATLAIQPDFGGAELGDCGIDVAYCNCPC